MTLNEVRSVIQGITYKPGWTFEVQRVPMWGPSPSAPVSTEAQLVITAKVLAADGSGEIISVVDRYTLNPYDVHDLQGLEARQYLLLVVRERLDAAERHEMKEWFKYQGRHVEDPHTPLTGRKASGEPLDCGSKEGSSILPRPSTP